MTTTITTKTITSNDYDDEPCVLMPIGDNGYTVQVGDKATSFRGENYRITGGRAPHKPESTGRVYVKNRSGEREFFPGVFDLKWVRVSMLAAEHHA
jgi:hypothetical protein